jgi:fatty acid desaturase
LPASKPQVIFGVTVPAIEDEPYLIHQFWFEDKPRVVSKEKHRINVLLSATAFGLWFLTSLPILGLWAVLILLVAILVTLPLAYHTFTKARIRAEREKARARNNGHA